LHLLLEASLLPADLLSPAVAVLPGAELGRTLLPGARNHLPAVLVLGASHHLLHAAAVPVAVPNAVRH
jgi:hypothetical protein